MPRSKYSKKVDLSAEDISTINISLREHIKSLKKIRAPNSFLQKEYREHLKKVKILQSRFQELSIKVEKEVLNDIRCK